MYSFRPYRGCISFSCRFCGEVPLVHRVSPSDVWRQRMAKINIETNLELVAMDNDMTK